MTTREVTVLHSPKPRENVGGKHGNPRAGCDAGQGLLSTRFAVRELVAAVLDARSAPTSAPAEVPPLPTAASSSTTSPQAPTGGPAPPQHSSFDPAAAETLIDILRERARAEPDRVHIHLYEEDTIRTITYGELFARASNVAASLRRRGLEPGRSVAIMLPTSAEFFFVFAGRRNSRADLSPGALRPHHGVCRAPSGNPAQR